MTAKPETTISIIDDEIISGGKTLDLSGNPKAMTEAERIQEEAYAAFDRWLAEQSDEVQDMSLLEQIEVYANVGR